MSDESKEELKEIVREVLKEMQASPEWYTNKDLYEMVEEWKGETQSLKAELQEFKTYIRHYNGISDTVDKNVQSIERLESNLEGKSKAKAETRDVVLVIVGVVSLVISLGAAIIMLVA